MSKIFVLIANQCKSYKFSPVFGKHGDSPGHPVDRLHDVDVLADGRRQDVVRETGNGFREHRDAVEQDAFERVGELLLVRVHDFVGGLQIRPGI